MIATVVLGSRLGVSAFVSQQSLLEVGMLKVANNGWTTPLYSPCGLIGHAQTYTNVDG